ncbi:hypothetical protein RBB50_009555 [Rhinocladiella similis]
MTARHSPNVLNEDAAFLDHQANLSRGEANCLFSQDNLFYHRASAVLNQAFLLAREASRRAEAAFGLRELVEDCENQAQLLREDARNMEGTGAIAVSTIQSTSYICKSSIEPTIAV